MDRQDYIDAAVEEIGTPFHHQGRVSLVGLDCIGLGVVVGEKVGDPVIYDEHDYPEYWEDARLYVGCKKALVEIHKGKQVAGDIVLFWLAKRTVACHLGFLIPGGYFIHAHYSAKEVYRSHLDDTLALGSRRHRPWRDRIHSAFRYPGLVGVEA